MQPYLRTRQQQDKRARTTGLVVTGVVHALAAVICLTAGLKYLDPPPPETSFVIDFEEDVLEPETPVQTRIGRQPQAEETDPTKAVELVQKAESPYVNDRPNTTPATRPDPHGDVEVPTPKQEEPKLDPRASFPGMSQKDDKATAPHSAAEASEGFKAGQPDGNTKEGRTTGNANAHLRGRNVVGTLPKPSYNAQMEGTVVVQVKVDQYGNVTEAIPGVEGTTVTDKSLWNAARAAAMKAHFNMSADAPVLQTGTITYKFKLQ
ncbi:MAG: TonB family protein [Bacteroidales bacterium]|nr:TonB family protein [Bacteroidales bacterium]